MSEPSVAEAKESIYASLAAGNCQKNSIVMVAPVAVS